MHYAPLIQANDMPEEAEPGFGQPVAWGILEERQRLINMSKS